MASRILRPHQKAVQQRVQERVVPDDRYNDNNNGDGNDEQEDEDNNSQPIEVRRVPEDQVQGLDQSQLSEVFTKVITATDPNVSKSIARFSYKEMAYKADPTVDHLAVHFAMDGFLIHTESDDAREQAHYLQSRTETEKKSTGTAYDLTHLNMLGVGAAAGATEKDDDDGSQRTLKNQFNFSERASQTFNNPMRDRMVVTEPPPTGTFSANVTHWEIYDTYMEDIERQLQLKAAKEKRSKFGGGDGDEKEVVDSKDVATANGAAAIKLTANEIVGLDRFATAVKFMERMVNHNSEADIFSDFKYFEDNSRDSKGSFLPLWRMTYDKARDKTVTAISWNRRYPDLFVVGFGSYDFTRPGTGLIACFSLKNTAWPEYTFSCDSGVMCLDFHPTHSALLAVGLYDGTVCVYDVRSKSNAPLYISADPKVKHTDPVWQVFWGKDEAGKNLNFYSISSDGRVTNWIMNKNELINEKVVELKLMMNPKTKEVSAGGITMNGASDSKSLVPLERKVASNGESGGMAAELDEDAAVAGLAGGCAIDFNKTHEHLFVVGTEEGAIHSYSKAYNSQFLRSFEGHHMAVYTVRWNPFHPGVFISCSADWTIKLWEVNTSTPIMSWDLNTSVADVAWAPWSSTVFAAITNDGKLRLYDLAVNKHEPVGETRVCKQKKPSLKDKDKVNPDKPPHMPTHLAFNPRDPVLSVGTNYAVLKILKLTSSQHRFPKHDEIDVSAEIQKLDRLLILPERPEERSPFTLGLSGVGFTGTIGLKKEDKKDKKNDKNADKPKADGLKSGAPTPRELPSKTPRTARG